MRFYASLLSLTAFLLAGCGQESTVNYGFTIDDVSVTRAYQSLSVNLRQNLVLSQQAREALDELTGILALGSVYPFQRQTAG